jgi:hypothetical protein
MAGPGPIVERLWNGLHVVHLLLAPVLGLASLSASSLVCALSMQWLQRVGRGAHDDYRQWQAMLDSGWVRSFMRLRQALPGPARWLLLLVYVGVEELMFRAVALQVFMPWGAGAAGIAACLLFIAVQGVGMPSLRHALFPVAGAVVMGPVHTWLALQGVPVVALIVSHLVFFAAAVRATPSSPQAIGSRARPRPWSSP